MKKSILISFGTFLALASMAQTNSPNVVASGGDFFTAGTFTNSFTIGEMTAVTTSTTGSFILTQGFQQPDDNINSVVENDHFIGFSAYPNPSNGLIAFDYNLTSNGKVSVEVFDALGQLVYNSNEEKLAGTQHDQLNLSVFANGLYSVRYAILTSEGNYDSFVSRITLTK